MKRAIRLLSVIGALAVITGLTHRVLATSTLVLIPSDDAHTDSSQDQTNFGQVTTLNVVKTDTSQKVSYLKFDLSTIDRTQMIAATLKLKVVDGSTRTQSLKLVTDTSWNEDAITYQNQPVASSTITTMTGYPTGSWVEFNVTDQVKAAANNAVSFAIDTQDTDELIFASKESPADNPQLVILTNLDPTPTLAPSTDVNSDGTTDYTDYTLVTNAVGTTGCNIPADVNRDCKVDIFDFASVTSQMK